MVQSAAGIDFVFEERFTAKGRKVTAVILAASSAGTSEPERYETNARS